MAGHFGVLRHAHSWANGSGDSSFPFCRGSDQLSVGSGALAPLWSVRRATWIFVRMVVDLLTDSEGTVDGWFWAFALSLSRPLFIVVRYGIRSWKEQPREGASTSERSEECERSMNPTTPSNRPFATTHTASGDGSTLSRRSDKRQGGMGCQAEGVCLKQRSDRPLTARACGHGKAAWSRMAERDARKPGMGKLNTFDGCEWIRLCDVHKERYGDWAMAQQCGTHGCDKPRSGKVVKGTLSKMCAEHETRMRPHPDSEKGAMGENRTSTPRRRRVKIRNPMASIR